MGEKKSINKGKGALTPEDLFKVDAVPYSSIRKGKYSKESKRKEEASK